MVPKYIRCSSWRHVGKISIKAEQMDELGGYANDANFSVAARVTQRRRGRASVPTCVQAVELRVNV